MQPTNDVDEKEDDAFYVMHCESFPFFVSLLFSLFVFFFSFYDFIHASVSESSGILRSGAAQRKNERLTQATNAAKITLS